jgi:dolichol-phosphate mannosyltransferase
MKTSLLILAYNEEDFIENVILKYVNEFNEIIVVNDKSSDDTQLIIETIQQNVENLFLINNKYNLGAGKSFEVGVKYFLNSGGDYLVKIDGDDQFSEQDVVFLNQHIKKEHFDFIKCDRFWHQGIVGEIPAIRYFGNSFASLLIKFSTGCWAINDPLNGLFVFSKEMLDNFKIPRLFHRYGYPFYVVTNSLNKSIINNFKIGQFKNEVKYSNEASYLNPFIMFFKLIWYTMQNYYTKIFLKIKISDFQISALIDILSQSLTVLSFYSIYKAIIIRYFSSVGPQGNWFLASLLFIFSAIFLINLSQKIESKITKNKIENINIY